MTDKAMQARAELEPKKLEVGDDDDYFPLKTTMSMFVLLFLFLFLDAPPSPGGGVLATQFSRRII